MHRIVALVLSLTVAGPAWADYSGSAAFDWASLTISGVPFTLQEHGQQQSTSLNNWNALNPQTFGDPLDTFAVTPHPQFVNDGFVQQPWTQQDFTRSLDGVGTAVSLSSADTLSASAVTHAADMGQLQATIERDGILTPTQTGNLTISVGYTLAYAGVPQTSGNVPEFRSLAHTQLTLDSGAAHAQLVALEGTASHTGTLSLTEHVTQGVASYFNLYAELNVNQPMGGGGGGRLPLPDLFWPTLLVMVGFVSFVVWRRRCS